MKVKNLLPIAVALFTLYTILTASSCRKETEPPVPYPIQGRWNLQNLVESLYNNNTNQLIGSQTTPASPGDYMEFRNDNRIYMQITGVKDTVGYSLISDNKLVYIDPPDRDTLDITTLTANNLSLKFTQYNLSNTPPLRGTTVLNLNR
jgi:hypothetical protein